MTPATVRKAFYAVVCFVSMGLSAWGAYTLLSAGLRSTPWLRDADIYYSPRSGSGEDEANQKNAQARRHADFSWAIPILVINAPIFLWFYPKVKQEELTAKPLESL